MKETCIKVTVDEKYIEATGKSQLCVEFKDLIRNGMSMVVLTRRAATPEGVRVFLKSCAYFLEEERPDDLNGSDIEYFANLFHESAEIVPGL